MNILSVSPDKGKAKIFLSRAEAFSRSLLLLKATAEIDFLLNTEYDILYMLSTAIIAYDGEKIQDKDHHKALFARIVEKYSSVLSPAKVAILDELRKIRNDINYSGEKDTGVLQDFYNRNKETIGEIRNGLFSIIREKIVR